MYVSDSGEVSVDNTAVQTLIQGSDDWAILTVKLQGIAAGDNVILIGRGSTGMLVEAGDQVPPIVIAPGTQVRVKTTSASAVVWGWSITYIPIKGMISALAYSMAYLNIIACALAGPQAVERADKEVRKFGIEKGF